MSAETAPKQEITLDKMSPLEKNKEQPRKARTRGKRSSSTAVAQSAPRSGGRIRALSASMDVPEPNWQTQTQAFKEWPLQGMQPNPKILEKLLIKWKIPIDLTNDKGETCLMHASYHGCRLSVDYLLRVRANPSLADKRGSTALFAAFSGQIINIPIIEALLRAGVSVDQRGPQKVTPLHLSASIGNLNLVKTLCKYGPNLLEPSPEGIAAEIAKKYGHQAVYEYLTDLARTVPKREMPSTTSGGRVNRRWSFAKRAADGQGGMTAQAMDNLAKESQALEAKPEPVPEAVPETVKEEPEEDDTKINNNDDETPDIPDYSECMFVDPKDSAKLTRFILQYDRKTAKLRLMGKVKEAFDQMDWRKDDNKISPKEFFQYFGQQGLNQRRCKLLFNRFDNDRNGTISYMEFNDRMQELKIVEEQEAPATPGSPRKKPSTVKQRSLNTTDTDWSKPKSP